MHFANISMHSCLNLSCIVASVVSTPLQSFQSANFQDSYCRSNEGKIGQDSEAVVTLLPAPVLLSLWQKARGQGSPQGAVKVKGLSLSKGSWSHHSDPTVHTICPVEFFFFFFLPLLFLIPPNGSGKTPDSSKRNKLWGVEL